MPMDVNREEWASRSVSGFSPSSLNELLFLFVIVAFYMFFCNMIQARNVPARRALMEDFKKTVKVNVNEFRVSFKKKKKSQCQIFTVIHFEKLHWGDTSLHDSHKSQTPLHAANSHLSVSRAHSSFNSTVTNTYHLSHNCHIFCGKTLTMSFFFCPFRSSSTPADLKVLCYCVVINQVKPFGECGRTGSLLALC